MTIFWDMDGTLCDFYGVDDWQKDLLTGNSRPYEIAKPFDDIEQIVTMCRQLQDKGIKIGVVSWLSKNATKEFKKKIRLAKGKWLRENFPIKFDEIHFIKYGTSKRKVCGDVGDVLIDDELRNVNNWISRKRDRVAIHVKEKREIVNQLMMIS